MANRLVNWLFRRAPRFRPPSDGGQDAQVRACPPCRIPVPGAPDARVDVYVPAREPQATVVWMHGGGFVTGHAGLVTHLARRIASWGYAVVSVGYSTAPTAHYPVPIQQVCAVLAGLERDEQLRQAPRHTVILGGDSAGAQIALQVASIQTGTYAHPEIAAGACEPEALAGLVLWCGLYDDRHLLRAVRPFVRRLLDTYVGGPSVSLFPPMQQLLGPELPPTAISVGNADPLAGQSYALARQLRTLGVRVDDLFWRRRIPPLGHEYALYMDTPAAQAAARHLRAFLQSCCALPREENGAGAVP